VTPWLAAAVFDRWKQNKKSFASTISKHNFPCTPTPKSMLKRFEQDLLSQEWKQVHEGLEVRLCAAPEGEEVFILCRSAERREKEKAMHERFEERIEAGLKKIQASCEKRKWSPTQVAQRVGRLLGENSRAAKLFQVQVEAGADGGVQLQWKKLESWREWARIMTDWRRRRVVARLHPVDGGRSRLSRAQGRSAVAAPSGTRKKNACKRTSWFVFWLICCGRR
jgi:hypothetical protein